MSSLNREGGPAFARPASVDPSEIYGTVDGQRVGEKFDEQEGMSLRDYFAAKVLQGMAANFKTVCETLTTRDGETTLSRATREAYTIANGMLIARSRVKPPTVEELYPEMPAAGVYVSSEGVIGRPPSSSIFAKVETTKGTAAPDGVGDFVTNTLEVGPIIVTPLDGRPDTLTFSFEPNPNADPSMTPEMVADSGAGSVEFIVADVPPDLAAQVDEVLDYHAIPGQMRDKMARFVASGLTLKVSTPDLDFNREAERLFKQFVNDGEFTLHEVPAKVPATLAEVRRGNESLGDYKRRLVQIGRARDTADAIRLRVSAAGVGKLFDRAKIPFGNGGTWEYVVCPGCSSHVLVSEVEIGSHAETCEQLRASVTDAEFLAADPPVVVGTVVSDSRESDTPGVHIADVLLDGPATDGYRERGRVDYAAGVIVNPYQQHEQPEAFAAWASGWLERDDAAGKPRPLGSPRPHVGESEDEYEDRRDAPGA